MPYWNKVLAVYLKTSLKPQLLETAIEHRQNQGFGPCDSFTGSGLKGAIASGWWDATLTLNMGRHLWMQWENLNSFLLKNQKLTGSALKF